MKGLLARYQRFPSAALQQNFQPTTSTLSKLQPDAFLAGTVTAA